MQVSNSGTENDEEASFMIAGARSGASADVVLSDEKPSFLAAYSFYINNLPRRVDDPTQPTNYRLAKPGELFSKSNNPAVLYDPVFMDAASLDEFGIGIGLYFRSLKLLFVVVLLCSIISIISLNANTSFNPTHSNFNSLQNKHNSTASPQFCPVELLGSAYGASRDDLKLSSQGAADLVIVIILVLFAYVAKHYEHLVIEEIDANNNTTQDYSVVIKNPLPDKDVDFYHEIFSHFGSICSITVAVNNGALCTLLAQKKKFQCMITDLEAKIGKGKSSQSQTASLLKSKQQLTSEIDACNNRLLAMSQDEYNPWQVFITFCHQEDQINCLNKMRTNIFERLTGMSINENAIIQDQMLHIEEAPEPSDVIYQYSHISQLVRWSALLSSYLLCGALLVLSWFIISALTHNNRKGGNVTVAIFISLINTILPEIVKFITLNLEFHDLYSDIELSILVKLVIVRCVNSGLIIFATTDYDEMFSLVHLKAIQNILIADAITTQILRFIDLSGSFQRYFLGMFASTQTELNSLWGGADWFLAERYTDTLKTVFVGIFFAVPLPSGLFITAFALFSTYLVDKYSLVRLWKRAPTISTYLASISRHFFILGIWAHVSVSRIYFANWPFGGVWDVPSDNFDTTCGFFFCNLYDEMTSNQRMLTQIYNVLSVITFVFVISWLILGHAWKWLSSIYQNNYSSESKLEEPLLQPNLNQPLFVGSTSKVEPIKDEHKSFINLQGENVYVPYVQFPGFDPVICADVSPDRVPAKFVDFRKMSPENVDAEKLQATNKKNPNDYSVVKLEEFPFLKTDERSLKMLKSMFGTVKYFRVERIESPRRENIPAYFAAIEKENENLPIGFEKKKTNTGRIYYINHADQSTHWQLPVPSSPGPVIDNESQDPAMNPNAVGNIQPHTQIPVLQTRTRSALPEGWSEGTTIDNRTYYMNHVTKTTQLTPPV